MLQPNNIRKPKARDFNVFFTVHDLNFIVVMNIMMIEL